MRSGREEERNEIPEIALVTTNPYGPGVTSYLKILEGRVSSFEESNPGIDIEEEFDISLHKKSAEEIFGAYSYAGLKHGAGLDVERFIAVHGKDSDYTLVINHLMKEIVLFINGESHPLKPITALSQIKGTEVLFE